MVDKTQRRRRKRRNSKFSLVSILLMMFILGLIAWGAYEIDHPKPAGNWFEVKSKANNKISLPQDDATHQTKMEWWYYNGRLKSKSGKGFSFHYAIFVVNGLASQVVGHVSLMDLQTGQHYIDQRRTIGAVSSITPGVTQFKLNVGNWEMLGNNGKDHLKVVGKGFGFDLGLDTDLPAVIHGNDGLLPLGDAGSSYYYSRTRMAVSGALKLGDSAEQVDGLVWFDHQWGDFLTTKLSWDWFSLQLADGSDVMLYNIKDQTNQPVLMTGSVSKNGVTDILSGKDFGLKPGKKWVSEKTGISYPVEWHINIPGKKMNIITHSVIDNSEFDAKLTTYNVYWEGAVNVRGSHSGQGFMELSGYRQ